MSFVDDKLILEASDGVSKAAWYNVARMLICAQLYIKVDYKTSSEYILYVSTVLNELDDNYYEN